MGTKKQSTLPYIFTIILIISSWVSLNEAILNSNKQKHLKECNIFKGHWAWDETYPLYDSFNCPGIRKEFNCLKYGRQDKFYLKFWWQPDECDLPRFDGKDLLRRMRGKKIMYVGDSLSLNYWQSMVCFLHSAVPNSNITMHTTPSTTSWTFQDYGVSVMLYPSLYLVDVVPQQIGRVLKLNSLSASEVWKDIDILVFNTWLWWGRRGPKQPWDFIDDGSQILKDMDHVAAFRKGLTTWANWVDSKIDPNKTRVFFQGINPSHYNGSEWNEAGVTDCSKETLPISRESGFQGRKPYALQVVKEVVSKMSEPKKVKILDITGLSEMRKDGHPSSHNGLGGMDCTHWCIAGVPDTWNHLLYTTLIV